VLGQLAQQHELKAGQGDGTAPRVGSEVRHVQRQAAGPDDVARPAGFGGADRISARANIFPQPEPDTCQQLGKQERLGQVILGAAFKAIDLRGGVV
jgi:hypothetical protein